MKAPVTLALASRMRNNALDVLSLIASGETQRRYQASAPYVDVPAELFNQWKDSFFPDDPVFQSAFDAAELRALRQFDQVINGASEATARQLPPLEAFMQTPEWHALSREARLVLEKLGRTPL